VEQRELCPLGESTPVAIDVRLLAATQSPLGLAVADRSFRGDLLARLSGLTVVVPPLRHRSEEIPALFSKMVEQCGRLPAPRLDSTLVERLCMQAWPFNIRELTLLARKLLALHPEAPVLDHTALKDGPGGELAITESRQTTEEIPPPDPATFLAALRAHNGNVKATAEILGISRGRAYRMMEKLDSLDMAALRRQDGQT